MRNSVTALMYAWRVADTLVLQLASSSAVGVRCFEKRRRFYGETVCRPLSSSHRNLRCVVVENSEEIHSTFSHDPAAPCMSKCRREP